ncbi:MAG: hypothetical protein AAGI91_12640 [Bacteroidota bacterium]
MPRLALALLLFTVPAGADEGRRANGLYGEEAFEEAAALYRDGLDRSQDEATRSSLLNNLGCALYEQEAFAEAQTAFEAALAAALTPRAQARAAYNAGNAVARQQNLGTALGFYRQALLAEPDHADAKFNYEYVKRRTESDPSQQPESERVQPSPFAQQLKAQADSLVAAQQYRAALETMQRGFLTDSTLQAYGDFLGRLSAVVEIDERTTEQP